MSDMNDPNSVLIEGKAVHDPELRYTPAGRPMCRFTIAVGRHGAVIYVDIRTMSRLADVCREHLKKGVRVQVNGCLEQERWVDSDGQDRSMVYILANNLTFEPLPNPEAGGE